MLHLRSTEQMVGSGDVIAFREDGSVEEWAWDNRTGRKPMLPAHARELRLPAEDGSQITIIDHQRTVWTLVRIGRWIPLQQSEGH